MNLLKSFTTKKQTLQIVMGLVPITRNHLASKIKDFLPPFTSNTGHLA